MTLTSKKLLGGLMAISAAIFVGIFLVALACPSFNDFVKPWLNYWGTFLGAIFAFASLGTATVITFELNESAKIAEGAARRVAICRALQSECRALMARMGIWRSYFDETLSKIDVDGELALQSPIGFPPLTVVENYLLDIGGLDRDIASSAFLLDKALAAAQHSLESNQRPDLSFDYIGAAEVRAWINSIFEEASKLADLLEPLTQDDIRQ